MHDKTRLTVILTLRGRHLHTLRWMWHANRSGFPYHVIVADGDVHPTIARLLSDPATFPNLSFEYRRYNDQTFTDFYKKCTDTIRNVRTEYVMMSDNDDFPLVSGIEKSVEHLNGDPGYVCAGGQLPSFLIVPRAELPGQVIGEMVEARFGYSYRSRDVAAPSSARRVRDSIGEYQTIYYHVYRAEALRHIFEEVETHDFSDLTVHEYFMALRTVTLGKVFSRPSIMCCIRQRGTSTATTYWVDWVHHLLRSRLPQDFRAMAQAIAAQVHATSGEDESAFREYVLESYANLIRKMLGQTMMRHRFPRLFRLKQRLIWLKRFRIVPLWLERRLSERAFFKRLAQDCPDAALLAGYKKELEAVKATLGGDDFLTFVKAKAPDLMSS